MVDPILYSLNFKSALENCIFKPLHIVQFRPLVKVIKVAEQEREKLNR